MPAPLEVSWDIRRGQSIDITLAVTLDGSDPRADGSWFVLAFKTARDDADSKLVFDSRDPKRALTVEGYDAGAYSVTLSFRASRGETLALKAGTLEGDLMRGRPRPINAFGDKFDAVAVVTANVV